MVDEAVIAGTWVRKVLDFSEPGTYFANSGALGWSIGASLGVKLAKPDQPVVTLVGDGSTLYGLQALWATVRYDIPVLLVVINNGVYRAVKYGLESYGQKAAKAGALIGVDLRGTDFVKVAEGFGWQSRRVEAPDQAIPSVREFLEWGKPALLDIIVDPKDSGYPERW